MKKVTKITHVLWSAGIGGTEEYVRSFAKFFDTSKYESTICLLSEKGVLFEEFAKNSSVNIRLIGMRNGFDVVGGLRFVSFLIRTKQDIVHMHIRNILVTAMTLLFSKALVVITQHRCVQKIDSTDFDMQRKTILFYRLFSRYLSRILAISNTVKDSLINYCGISDHEKIEIIYNGIDLSKFDYNARPPPDLRHLCKEGVRIIGFVGRMVPSKRTELFIRIAAGIIAQSKEFRFVMVGDGPELDRCRALIAQKGLDDYFELLGFRRDIPNVLQLFDAMLFTSQGEGFGIVLIEAMAMGVPIFSINDGAVSEIIQGGCNGYLLDELDPDILAREVLDSFAKPSLIEKLKKQAMVDVREQFSIENNVRQTELIYEKVLAGL